jgi:hypothetical protein
MHMRKENAAIEYHEERWEKANDYDGAREMVTLITDPGLPRGREWDRAEKALNNLRGEGLVDSRATYWDSTEQGIVSFNMTSFGIDLFAAAWASKSSHSGISASVSWNCCNSTP